MTIPRTLTDKRGRLILETASGMWWVYAAAERPRIGRWPSPSDPEPDDPRFLIFLGEREDVAYQPCPVGWRHLAADELEQLLQSASGSVATRWPINVEPGCLRSP